MENELNSLATQAQELNMGYTETIEEKQKSDFYTPLDRISIIATNFEQYVKDYPSILFNEKLREKSIQISELLWEFYQEIGEHN